MASSSHTILHRGEPGILQTFHVRCVHSWLWEIPPNFLRHQEIPIGDSNRSKLRCCIAIVSFAIVKVWTNIDSLHVIKDCFPLFSHVYISTSLPNVVNIDFKCSASSEHNSFDTWGLSTMLHEVRSVNLQFPFVRVSFVVYACYIIKGFLLFDFFFVCQFSVVELGGVLRLCKNALTILKLFNNFKFRAVA